MRSRWMVCVLAATMVCCLGIGVYAGAKGGKGKGKKNNDVVVAADEYKGVISEKPAAAPANVLAVLTVVDKKYNLTSTDNVVTEKIKGFVTRAVTVAVRVIVKGAVNVDGTAIAVTDITEEQVASTGKAKGKKRK